MGGSGSGRRQRFTRNTTDGCLALDITVLGRRGSLEPGRSGTVSWSRDGQPIGSVTLLGLPDGIRLSYRGQTGEGAWEVVDEVVDFLVSATTFGNGRRWFACPACARRCRILYGGARFRCRHCNRLRYESQFESAAQRANRLARKIRRRLGGSEGLMDEFPPRPRGMHWATYRRLETMAAGADERWEAAVMTLVGRFRGRRQ